MGVLVVVTSGDDVRQCEHIGVQFRLRRKNDCRYIDFTPQLHSFRRVDAFCMVTLNSEGRLKIIRAIQFVQCHANLHIWIAGIYVRSPNCKATPTSRIWKERVPLEVVDGVRGAKSEHEPGMAEAGIRAAQLLNRRPIESYFIAAHIEAGLEFSAVRINHHRLHIFRSISDQLNTFPFPVVLINGGTGTDRKAVIWLFSHNLSEPVKPFPWMQLHNERLLLLQWALLCEVRHHPMDSGIESSNHPAECS